MWSRRIEMSVFRPCSCLSGKESYWICDAAGIALCRVCEACESEKRAHYNPAIFKNGTAYSVTGDETLIGYEEDIEE
jgi:hypothetical protein